MSGMRFDSFLENLYFGRLDLEAFRYRESPLGDPDVERMTRAFVEASKDYPPDKLEALGRVPPELLDKLAKSGFFGLDIPKEYGGQGLDLQQYLAVVENIVKIDMALGILSLAHLSIGVKGVALYGTPEQKLRYLPKAASGEMVFCYALTEPMTGSDARNIKTFAEKSPDGSYYTLNGTKTFITNANYSGGLTVFAQLNPEKAGMLGAFIVETAWEGVTIGKDMEKMGLSASSTASIQLKNVKVPAENLLGGPGDGFKIAMTILNYGRLALGAASSGMLDASLTDMMKRAEMRIQFQNPLIHFELIQEKILRAWVEKETITAMTGLTAGMMVKNPLAEAVLESSHVKLYGTNRAWETLYDAMQVAGGSGYLKNQPYDKRMRDFRVATIFEGTTEIHSVYPPLTLARLIQKTLKGKSFLGRFAVLAGLGFSGDFWRLPMRSKALLQAEKLMKYGARTYRRLFLSALLRIGPSLPMHEFLLRRMTEVSVRTYAVASLAAKIIYQKSDGKETQMLEKLLENVCAVSHREIRKNRNFRPDAVESRHHGLFRLLRSEKGK